MWTPETREKYDRRDLRYPSDIRNEEWEVIQPLLPKRSGIGRPPGYTDREIINGIRYVLKYGIPWDAMPKDLPHHQTCYDYWRMLDRDGHLRQINHYLVMADREKAGRESSPTMIIIDAQSVKCDAPQGERGYDAGKKVNGRKRHFAVDCEGRLIDCDVTTADEQDQDAGLRLACNVAKVCPWVELYVADSAYKNRFCEGVRTVLHRVTEIVKRPDFAKGFVLLPKRWIVEQAIGVLGINRRLKTCYESIMDNSCAMIFFASICRLSTSLARA
jgi:transposase